METKIRQGELKERSTRNMVFLPRYLLIRRPIRWAVRYTFRWLEAVGDGFHRGYGHMGQAGVTGDFVIQAFALLAQHVAHALQLKNNPIDFLRRSTGDATDQLIQVFGGSVIGRTTSSVFKEGIFFLPAAGC